MIKAKVKIRLPKLTVEQKALKKVVTEVSKAVTKNIKTDVRTWKVSGALGFSLGSKVVSKKGFAYAIIGVKSRYSKQVVVNGKVLQKIPNLYGKKQNLRHEFLQKHINANTVEMLRVMVRQTASELISGN